MSPLRTIQKPALLAGSVLLACAGAIYWMHRTAPPAPNTEATLRARLQSEPTNAALNESLANFLLQQNRPQDAIPFFQAAIKSVPDNATAPCSLARIFLAQNRTLEANKILESAFKLHPQDPGLNEAMADALLQSLGQDLADIAYAKVQPLYETALKADPGRVSAALNLAKIYIAQNRLDAATTLLQKCLAQNPRSAAALHLELANLLALRHNYADAAPHYNAATALDSSNEPAYGAWGVMLIDAGKAHTAITVLQKAVDLHPTSAENHMHLGRAYREDGDIASAMKQFQIAIDKDEKYAPAYLEFSKTYQLSHREPDQAQAEDYLRLALIKDPSFTPAKIALARMLANSPNPARVNFWQAANYMGQAVADTHEQDISLLVAHAELLDRVGQSDQAAARIDQALALGRARGLTAPQHEKLLQLRQTYFLNSLPAIEAESSVFSVDGRYVSSPFDEPLPTPQQPPVSAILTRPLDFSQPISPGSALDPEIYISAALEQRPDYSSLFPGMFK